MEMCAKCAKYLGYGGDPHPPMLGNPGEKARLLCIDIRNTLANLIQKINHFSTKDSSVFELGHVRSYYMSGGQKSKSWILN